MKLRSFLAKSKKALQLTLMTAFVGTQLVVPLSVSGVFSGVAGATKPGEDELHKVTICHRTKSVTNPYVQNDVDEASVDGNNGNDNGKGDHLVEHTGAVWDANTNYPTPHNGDQWGDIIPPFYDDGVTLTGYPSLNWDAAGQAIFYNGCNPEGTNESTEVRAKVTFEDLCGTENDTYKLFDREGVVYKVDGSEKAAGTYSYDGGDTLTVTAEAASSDYVLKGDDTFSLDFTNKACENEPTEVRAKVTFKDACETNKDSYTIFDREGVVYKVNGQVVSPDTYDGSATVTVTAEAASSAYVLKGDTSFSFDFTDEDCPEVKKIDICHATAAIKNPYNMINVRETAADGVAGNSGQQPDHFGEHTGPIFDPAVNQNGDNWGDIIPPIPGVHGGLNWDSFGQAVYNNDCNLPTKVTPAEVTFTLPTCEVLTGSYTIPTTTGVKYQVSLNGGAYQDVSDGTYNVTAGSTVQVKAVAVSSDYFLMGTTSWGSSFPAETDCVLGDTDVCPNIDGSQSTVPAGMTKDSKTGNCVTATVPGGEVLGESTTLVNTGESTIANIVVGALAIGLALGTALLSRRTVKA
jgi:hypothetical protein